MRVSRSEGYINITLKGKAVEQLTTFKYGKWEILWVGMEVVWRK